MRTRFGLAEKLRATSGAEPPVHHVAAVGDATVSTRGSLDGEGCRGEADVDCAATRPEVLTDAAPAYPRDNGFRRRFVADLLAQTATRNRHCIAPQFDPPATPVAYSQRIAIYHLAPTDVSAS